jgi:hypothetical protein
MDAETLANQKAKFYLDRFGSVYPTDAAVREFLAVIFGPDHVRERLRIRRHRGRAYIVDIDTDCILGSGPNSADAAIEADAKFKQTLSGTTPENQTKPTEEIKMDPIAEIAQIKSDLVQLNAAIASLKTATQQTGFVPQPVQAALDDLFATAQASPSLQAAATASAAASGNTTGGSASSTGASDPNVTPGLGQSAAASNPASTAPSGNASDPVAPTPGPTPAEQVTAASVAAASNPAPVPTSN